jgi:hypothetical protein
MFHQIHQHVPSAFSGMNCLKWQRMHVYKPYPGCDIFMSPVWHEQEPLFINVTVISCIVLVVVSQVSLSKQITFPHGKKVNVFNYVFLAFYSMTLQVGLSLIQPPGSSKI